MEDPHRHISQSLHAGPSSAAPGVPRVRHRPGSANLHNEAGPGPGPGQPGAAPPRARGSPLRKGGPPPAVESRPRTASWALGKRLTIARRPSPASARLCQPTPSLLLGLAGPEPDPPPGPSDSPSPGCALQKKGEGSGMGRGLVRVRPPACPQSPPPTLPPRRAPPVVPTPKTTAQAGRRLSASRTHSHKEKRRSSTWAKKPNSPNAAISVAAPAGSPGPRVGNPAVPQGAPA